MIIRPETLGDHDSIRNILIAAFANHPYSHQTEHLIVEALRADDALTVSLVAEVDGTVVGQIAFSPLSIDGKDCGWLALGPVAVLPSYQRQGIGQALVNEGLKTIRSIGVQGCVLVGDPAFYRRFGFYLDFCKMMVPCYKTGPSGHSKWLSMLARKRALSRTVA